MTAGGGKPRAAGTLLLLVCLGLAACAGFVALGTWQVHRRSWKLALIERVDQRIHAPPAAPPGPADWPAVSAVRDQYKRVKVTGRFLNGDETLVQAVTDLGGGDWVMTPFQTDAGFTVLINRGFVPPDRRDPATRQAGQIAGQTTVTGLLRITEPGGGFLRSNDPAAGRWYSRDVAAIAHAHNLSDVAPYFIDADASRNPGGYPIGGLTVVSFPNSHLIYAITWYTLALMAAAAVVAITRDEWRLRHRLPSQTRASMS